MQFASKNALSLSLLQAEEELDFKLACLLSSKWIAKGCLATDPDDPLELKFPTCGQVGDTLSARAMSMPIPGLTHVNPPPPQSAFQSCAMEADDAQGLGTSFAGQDPAAMPSRAMSMPTPGLTDVNPGTLQSAFQAWAGDMWPDDELPRGPSPAKEIAVHPTAAKSVARTAATTSKNPKKWEELREKR